MINQSNLECRKLLHIEERRERMSDGIESKSIYPHETNLSLEEKQERSKRDAW